jgi:hypothetical protein
MANAKDGFGLHIGKRPQHPGDKLGSVLMGHSHTHMEFASLGIIWTCARVWADPSLATYPANSSMVRFHSLRFCRHHIPSSNLMTTSCDLGVLCLGQWANPSSLPQMLDTSKTYKLAEPPVIRGAGQDELSGAYDRRCAALGARILAG